MNNVPQTATAPVVEDLSTYFVGGRLASKVPPGQKYETSIRTPRQGLDDAVEAERLGYRRAFISERWNLKEVSAILGGVGALTSRIELGTCVIPTSARHPLHAAAFGATMHALYGPRFILGLGRGEGAYVKSLGLPMGSYPGLVDYVNILRRLWAGEVVNYDGPAGRFQDMALGDNYHGPAPKVFFGMLGGPIGSKAAAAAFDGVLLSPFITPRGGSRIVSRLRRECAAIDRDPDSLRICQCVVTTPGLGDEETRQLAHARAVTALQAPGYRDALATINDWDPAVIERLVAHKQFAGMKARNADLGFHRIELMGPARLIPDEWMLDACAIGSVDECVASLRRFKEAGIHEIITYGSTPGQNAELIAAWRESSRLARDSVDNVSR